MLRYLLTTLLAVAFSAGMAHAKPQSQTSTKSCVAYLKKGKGVMLKVIEAQVETPNEIPEQRSDIPLLHFVTNKPPATDSIIKKLLVTVFKSANSLKPDGTIYRFSWAVEWPLWVAEVPAFLKDEAYHQRLAKAIEHKRALATLTPTPQKPGFFTLSFLIEDDGGCTINEAYDGITVNNSLIPFELATMLAKVR